MINRKEIKSRIMSLISSLTCRKNLHWHCICYLKFRWRKKCMYIILWRSYAQVDDKICIIYYKRYLLFYYLAIFIHQSSLNKRPRRAQIPSKLSERCYRNRYDVSIGSDRAWFTGAEVVRDAWPGLCHSSTLQWPETPNDGGTHGVSDLEFWYTFKQVRM
jgi:hypothetical protein